MGKESFATLQSKASLPVESLKTTVDYEKFSFDTTEQVPGLTGVVGQERGREAMRFGLQVNKPGYHIYVAGLSGTGKTSYTRSIVNEFAKKPGNLYDWCYVYNFEDKSKPKVLQLPAGMGKSLQADMDGFIENLKVDIPKAFSDENYQKERQTIIRSFQEQSNTMFESLNAIAKEDGFVIRQSGSEFLTIPVQDGKPISEEEFHLLDQEKVKELDEKSAEIREKVLGFTRELRRLEKETNQVLKELEQKIASAAVDYHMDDLVETYKESEHVTNYLKALKEDILTNISDFKEKEPSEEQGDPFLSLLGSKSDSSHKYQINMLIDHSETKGVPVITADNPNYYNLIGKVDYETRMGMLSTDFTKIMSGYLHQANGGYLIIQARDILSNNFAWEALKRALTNGYIRIENIGEQLGTQSTSSLKPDSIPLDVKVVIIGGTDIYQLFYQYDEDFRKLFKIRADFDLEMEFNEDNVKRMASFIHTRCKEDNLKSFDRSAVAKIVEYSARLAGNQHKLSTRFNQIVEVIYEADTWAELAEADIVTGADVKKAINQKKYRSNLYEEKLAERMAEGDILIDTDGGKVGQVNGLAVYQMGEYNFGKPTRITASTFVGQRGIINIERESEMSGNIHNKGVYILSGYMGTTFAQKQPLSLSANLAFEQSYGGVDGDSASSTELYALLSSLAELPINQGLAVTGSVNQNGEIQPIGGVNEKIEGFFDVCQARGLTGEQGVIIPHQNMKNLMLKDEVIEAVKEQQFHIFQVETVEEGIELLTGWKAGKKNKDGSFEENTVYHRVSAKLKQFLKASKVNKTKKKK